MQDVSRHTTPHHRRTLDRMAARPQRSLAIVFGRRLLLVDYRDGLSSRLRLVAATGIAL
jgi:hypothetical protein